MSKLDKNFGWDSSHMHHASSHTVKRFVGDQRGSILFMFALSVVPMLLLVGIAVDYSRAITARRDLQQAVDSAAIAAAVYKMEHKQDTLNTLKDLITQSGQKSPEQVAIDYVMANASNAYLKNIRPEATESDDSNILTVKANANVDTTFARLVMNKFNLEVEAKTRMAGQPMPLCLLGLNKSAPQVVKAWGSGEVIATDCAVLSNSKNENGLVTGGSATMKSSAFCSAGGVSGTGFTPRPHEKCDQQKDPYEGKFTRQGFAAQGINVAGACNETGFIAKKDAEFNAGSGVFTFCNGLEVRSKKTVTLGPGIYVIYGELHLNAKATLDARNGTTLVLADARWMPGQEDGHIAIQGQGNILVTAPTSGPTASMAVIQATVSNYTGGTDYANQHVLRGGGTIEFVGNWYTPQSKTLITGNGEMNAASAYFSLISDFVEVEGNGTLRIRAGGDPDAVAMTAVPGRMTSGRFITLIQ